MWDMNRDRWVKTQQTVTKQIQAQRDHFMTKTGYQI
jgi:hypothetical protein